MKKIILFACLALASLSGFAKNNFLPSPNQVFIGDTITITYISCCDSSVFYLPMCGDGFCYLADPITSISNISYNCNGIHYYEECDYISFPINIGHDTILNCCIDSVNNAPLTSVHRIVITVHHAPTVSIPPDSIHHVTCPNGDFHPYGDGAFSVTLDDPVQNYAWIDVQSDSLFFFIHTYYDDFTVNGLRAGTYHVIAHGTNGCEYHDSVTIEQPEPWDFAFSECRSDTVCPGIAGCLCIDVIGGTPPYNYTWFYLESTENGLDTVYLEQATDYACGLYSGMFYRIYMYDSRGCKAFGEEIEFIATYLFEYVEDSTHLITTNPIACYGSPYLAQAQSMGNGSYTWHVGDQSDSVNYSTWVAADSVLVADYYTPPMTESSWISVDFSDQHGCVTHDSVWVDVFNSNISMTIETQELMADSTYTVQVSPPGGNLYMDDNLIASTIPSNYTVSTAGIPAGEHTLKYAGVFGSEVGLSCEDEVSITIQVQVQPFVTVWNQDISIYPNPATTVLNLSSTEMMDLMVSVTDITGRIIQTEKVLDSYYVIDVSNLTAGIYLLNLETPESATKTMKFVKQ
jgi:hypothetical protein